MTHAEVLTRVSDWMRFWAPEIKRRVEGPEPGMFPDLVEAYSLVRSDSDSPDLVDSCWAEMQEAQKILDEAPPGAYDYLAHVGVFVQ